MAKKILLGVGLLLAGVVVAGLGVFGYASHKFNERSAIVHPLPELNLDADVAKADVGLGKKIFTQRAGCFHCHGEDGAGISVVNDPVFAIVSGANVTPYALKSWTNDQIGRAIRYGLDREGRSLIFMPSAEFQNLAREDLAAVVAYVRSLPPVQRETVRPDIRPAAKIFHALVGIPVLIPADEVDPQAKFITKPAEAPTREFGQYLVTASCKGCHGPELKGGPIPGGDPSWPPAASLRLGADPVWTEASFTQTLRTGMSARTKQALRQPMIDIVAHPVGDTEVRAIWNYLSTLK